MYSQHLALAIACRENGEYEEADRILNDLFNEEPNNPIVNYQLAWLHDVQGLESAAVPYYERAIQNGLSGMELRGALLGLGSTYRCLGQYDNAVKILSRGIELFPDAQEFTVFLAMVYYNIGQHAEAMSLLLRTLVNTTQDAGITDYKKAILFYHDKLDEIWT